MRQAEEDGIVVEIKYEGRATDSEITDHDAMNHAFIDIFGYLDDEEQLEILGKYTVRGYLEAQEVINEKAADMIDRYDRRSPSSSANTHSLRLCSIRRESAVGIFVDLFFRIRALIWGAGRRADTCASWPRRSRAARFRIEVSARLQSSARLKSPETPIR